jgi:protein-S-isoprenylcysteine O-methyltransferase Ste14
MRQKNFGMADQASQPKPKFGHGERQAMVSLGVTLAIMIGVMFGAAGTFEWVRGWVFFAVYCALTAIACLWLWRVNPEIFAARSKMQAGTKSWDKLLTILIILAFMTILPVSALDDGRFHWAVQPDWVVALGLILFVAGFSGLTWASSVNRHFEATVRIQTDREHKVIDTGPYAIVRHPGYSFGLALVAGMPLAMGSLFGLIPAGIMALLILTRTLAEDATLMAELPGYREYAARVKQRWIPGVW